MHIATFFGSALTIQGMIAAIVLMAVAFAPPASGYMLVMPLFASARPAVSATLAGGVIVAIGTVPGSIIVRGDRAKILPAALADGSIVFATGRRGCGAQGWVS